MYNNLFKLGIFYINVFAIFFVVKFNILYSSYYFYYCRFYLFCITISSKLHQPPSRLVSFYQTDTLVSSANNTVCKKKETPARSFGKHPYKRVRMTQKKIIENFVDLTRAGHDKSVKKNSVLAQIFTGFSLFYGCKFGF